MGFNGIGVLVGKGCFGEVGITIKPTDIDVFGVMFDEVTSMIGSPVFSSYNLLTISLVLKLLQ